MTSTQRGLNSPNMSKTKLPTVFWVGDSIALHYQPYLLASLESIAQIEFRQGYQEAIKNLDHPRGANCGDSSMVFSFLQTLLKEPAFDAEWIVFNCGLHDIKTDLVSGIHQVGISDYEKNLRAILGLIRQHKRKAAWITTTPVDDRRHRKYCHEILRFQRDVEVYNALAAQVMESQEIPCIDLHRFTSELEGDIYCDHVHYIERVRELQAAFVSREFRSLLTSGKLKNAELNR